jgi:hypothetical protein
MKKLFTFLALITFAPVFAMNIDILEGGALTVVTFEITQEEEEEAAFFLTLDNVEFEACEENAEIEGESIFLETTVLKHNLTHKREIESYINTLPKADNSFFRKGRFAVRARPPRKGFIFEPTVRITDEFSLLFNERINIDQSQNLRPNHIHQEIGIRYSPKYFQGSSFSISGQGGEKQRIRLGTEFLLW